MKFCYQHKTFQVAPLNEKMAYPEYTPHEVYSFIWVAEEKLHIKIDNVKHHIEAPAILCISPNQELKILQCHDNQYLLQHNKQFYSTLHGDKEISTSGLLFHNACKNIPIKVNEVLKERLQRFINMLYEEMQKQDELKEEMIRTLLKGFIIITTRLAKKQIFEKHIFSRSEIALFQKFVFLVDTHFKEHHQVKFYAELLYKAPKSLTNQFALLDLPMPKKIIDERIMLEAKNLLLNTSLSFSEITFMLGFEELSQFSRFFKTKSGISPSAFRQNNQPSQQ